MYADLILLVVAGSDLNDDEDDRLADIPEDSEAPPSKRHQKSGQLDTGSNGNAPVAMPDNYPEEWKRKFAEGYQSTAENIGQVDTKGTSRAGPPPESTPNRRSMEDTTKPLPYADTHASGGVDAKHVTADEAAEEAQVRKELDKGTDRVVTSVKGAAWERGSETLPYNRPFGPAPANPDDPARLSPFATAADPNLASNSNATVVSLSQINPEMLAEERGPETGPVGLEKAESDMSEHDIVTLGPDGVPIAGLMQAGMNEPSGALGAPSELSLQHTTYSGKVRDSY